MSTLLRRELAVVAGRRAFLAAACAHAALLVLFLQSWTDGAGVSALAPRSIYEQLRLVQFGLLLVLLPWTACRTMAEERGPDLVLLAGAAAVAPGRLMAARVGAVALSLALLSLAGLPPAAMAFRMTPDTSGAFILDEAVNVAAAIAAAALALAWRHAIAGRVSGWVAATATFAGLAVAARGSLHEVAAIAVLAGAGGAVGLLLVSRADVSLRYLDDAS